MLKKLVVLCVLLFTLVSIKSQQRSIYFESHVLQTDSNYAKCYLSFKLAYNRLVFIKKNGYYTAGAEVHYDLFAGDKVSKHLTSSNSIEVNKYENTKSADLFLEGLVEFDLEPGRYKVVPSILLENTKDEILLKKLSFELDIDSSSAQIFTAVTFSDIDNCDGVSGKRLVNMKDIIPFDTKKYDLLITLMNQDADSLKIEVSQDSQVVIEKTLKNYVAGGINISLCNNQVICSVEKNVGNFKTFLLKDVNAGLIEGPADLTILSDSDTLFTEHYNVVWYNRPKVLDDVELAARLYEKVTNDSKIDSIFDAPSEEYYKNLFKYWEKLDPVKTTSFNELMYEFYNRADIADKRFKTTDNLTGARTDRGIIFIKYGEPDEIKRNYGTKNNIIEIWKYDKLGRQFVFEDTSGLGNYQLVE